MPGEVLSVKVKVGDQVEKGQQLVILSAMKMEMVVGAPISGVVKDISIEPGMKLEGDDLLVNLEWREKSDLPSEIVYKWWYKLGVVEVVMVHGVCYSSIYKDVVSCFYQ